MLWILFSALITECFCITTKQFGPGEMSEMFIDGDFIIGALTSVRAYEFDHRGLSLTCGDLQAGYVIQTEALRLSVEHVNRNVLQNSGYQLGLWVMDDCDILDLGMHHCVSFLAGKNLYENSICYEFDVLSNSTRKLLGVIDSSSSSLSIQIEPLLAAFKVSLVSADSTAMELDKQSLYPYFLRTVPSDYYMVQAIYDLLKRMNWNLVILVYESTAYGQGLRDELKNVISAHQNESIVNERGQQNMCVELSIKIDTGQETFQQAFDNLKNVRGRVVVVLMAFSIARQFFVQINRTADLPRFQWVATGGWGNFDYVTQDLESILGNTISAEYAHYPLSIVDEFLKDLTYAQVLESRNPWLRKLVQQQYCCRLSFRPTWEIISDGIDDCNSTCPFSNETRMNLKGVDIGVDHAYFTYEAILAFTMSFEELRKQYCPISIHSCKDIYGTMGSELLKILEKITFDDSLLPRPFSFFNRSGQPYYAYYQFKKSIDHNTGQFLYSWMPVGTWHTDDVEMRKVCTEVSMNESDNCVVDELGQEIRQIEENCRDTCQCCLQTVCQQHRDDYGIENVMFCTKISLSVVGMVCAMVTASVLIRARRTAFMALETVWVTGIGLMSVLTLFVVVIGFAGVGSPSGVCMYALPSEMFSLSVSIGALLVKTVRLTSVIGDRKRVCKRHAQLLLLITTGSVQLLLIGLWGFLSASVIDSGECRTVDELATVVLVSFPFLMSAFISVYSLSHGQSDVLYIDRELRHYRFTCGMIQVVLSIYAFLVLSLLRLSSVDGSFLLSIQEIMIIACGYLYLGTVFGPNVYLICFQPSNNTVTYLSQQSSGSTIRGGEKVFVIRPSTSNGTGSVDILKRLLHQRQQFLRQIQ